MEAKGGPTQYWQSVHNKGSESVFTASIMLAKLSKELYGGSQSYCKIQVIFRRKGQRKHTYSYIKNFVPNTVTAIWLFLNQEGDGTTAGWIFNNVSYLLQIPQRKQTQKECILNSVPLRLISLETKYAQSHPKCWCRSSS